MSWVAVQQVTVSVTVENNGAAIGIGNAFSYCTTTVTINRVPLPPVLTNTVFFVPELSPVGTLVGNVAAIDPANFTVRDYVWAFVDPVRPTVVENLFGRLIISLAPFRSLMQSNPFAIDRTNGTIIFTSFIDTIVLLKNVWTVSLMHASRKKLRWLVFFLYCTDYYFNSFCSILLTVRTAFFRRRLQSR